LSGEAGFETLFHPEFAGDLRRLPANVRERILTAVEKRLGRAPDQYGQRLRQSLHGYWKLRVGDYRVVYEIVGREVRVYGVLHRRDVYTDIVRRTARGWAQRPR
jgi:mRNA interferase RelE/StbE